MKKILSIVLLCIILANVFIPVYADNVSEGSVTFTSRGTMEQKNFDVDQIFENLEPGDTRSYYVTVTNAHPSTTRWYMSNEVLKTLEASEDTGAIRGGAYTYELTYEGPGGRKELYKHDKDGNWVGGDQGFKIEGEDEERIGLREATSNLEDFFFLDTLNSGESGKVKLTVSLEGETQGNIYQNTAARIKMNFAVELANNTTNRSTQTAVKTGDENNLVPYYVGMIVAGLLFLYLALDAVTDRMYKKGKG